MRDTMLQTLARHLVPPASMNGGAKVVAPVLPHGWAGSTGHVRVTPDGANMRRASGEVVIEGVSTASGGGAAVG
jgi:hypothetical protein